MGTLTLEEVLRDIRANKKYLDQLRDYDLGKWRPKKLIKGKKT